MAAGVGAPVFVQLQANRTRGDLFAQRAGQAGVALAQKAQVHRQGVRRLQHALDVPGAGRAGGGKSARGRTRAAAHHGGDAAGQRFFDLLRADEVDVAVHAARGDDAALAGDDFGARADDDVHARLHVGVAGLAYGRDAPAAQANVGLDDAPVVEDQCVGQHRVHGAAGLGAAARAVARALALRHAVAYGLAAAELRPPSPVAAGAQRVVGLDFDDQVGVGQTQAVAHGGAEHLGIRVSLQGGHGGLCSGSLLMF